MAVPELLRDVLPGVSRSFALSLRVLPGPLRRPFGVTYLVARAADTIADTRALPPAARLTTLRALREALADGAPPPLWTGPPRAATPPPTDAPRAAPRRAPGVPGPRAPADRARSREVLLTLTQAMVEALRRFPPEMADRVGAFDTRAELDRYTYMNAGCVGSTGPRWSRRTGHAARGGMCPPCARAARFRPGLQLINVLRDLPRDLRIGRCYLRAWIWRRSGSCRRTS